MFPFKYAGVTYNACTKRADIKPWCGTKSKVEFWTRTPRGNCESYGKMIRLHLYSSCLGFRQGLIISGSGHLFFVACYRTQIS